MKSDYFGPKNCAYCLGFFNERLSVNSNIIRKLVSDDITGIDNEILIPRGFQKFHKKCWGKLTTEMGLTNEY